MSSMFGQLRKTHPLLGKAAYGAWFESDLTGDYPGRRIREIVQFDESVGECQRCGTPQHRQFIASRTLVGPNRGEMFRWWSADCHGPGCPSSGSNYRPCWHQ
jgi:hypothetical protein